MSIEKEKNGSELKITISGKLNTKTAPELQEIVDSSLDEVTSVIMDLTETEYVSSGGLRVLLTTQQRMDEKKGSMWIEGANETIRDIFDVTGFKHFLRVR